MSTADGPGTAVTGTPASTAARTTRSPGSETLGIPASVTHQHRRAADSGRHQVGGAGRLVVLVVADHPPGEA